MSDSTPRMAFPYPSRDEDPWYDTFQVFTLALDAAGYAHREDRSILYTGGGTLSWTLGTSTFTWTDTMQIMSPIGGRRISISANSIVVAEGQVVYTTLTRQPLENLTASLSVANQLPSSNTVVALAIRYGGVLYFRTGMSLQDGNTVEGLSPVPGGGGGGYVDIGGTYSYVEAATPVEEVVGQTPFDASTAAGATIILKVTVTPVLTSGNCSIKFYDLGPVGTPGAPRLVSTLTTSTSGGPQVLQQTLTAVASSPTTNEIIEANYVYEVVVTSAATTGDSVFVGGARIEVA